MARRKLNPSGGQIALAAGAAILAGLAVRDVFASPRKTKKNGKEPEEPAPSPDDEEKKIADELLDVISENPAPGSLYQVRKGDNFANIARDVFSAAGIPDARQDGGARVAYMKCVSSSEFNRTLYGKSGDFTNNFPEYTSPDNISLRSAFLNKSTDYITQLLNGQLPVRASGPNYGLLWLPSIDTNTWNQFGKIVCIDIDPPPLTEMAES